MSKAPVQFGTYTSPNVVSYNHVPAGSKAAALVAKFQAENTVSRKDSNLTAAQLKQVLALLPSSARAAIAATKRSASATATAGVVGAMSGKPAPKMSELRDRISKLEGKIASARVDEDPLMRAARKNSARALRLIACPDEIAKVGVHEMPLVPTDSTSARFPMVTSLISSINLNAFNTLVQVPGQTSFGLAITSGGTGNNGIVALNMGSPDLCWTLAQAGATSLTAASWTRRLVPTFHLGYVASCATAQPSAPAVVEFGGTDSVYFPITDGAGNYIYVRMPASTATMYTIVGTCTISATPFVSTTTYPILNISTLSSPAVSMTITPLIPTTGAAVRSMLMAEGATGANAGPDVTFSPMTVVASNIRIQSLASALINKVSVVSYAIAGGREGVYANVPAWAGNAVSGLPVPPSVATLAARSRQHSMGLLNPDNDAWYAVNIAARLSEMEEGEAKVINDLSYIGRSTIDNTVALSGASLQGDVSGALIPTNLPMAGWDNNFVFSVSFLATGASGAVSIPVQLEAYSWNEYHVPSELGLPVRSAAYYSEFKAWLQVVSTYPVLACADSFRDFFKAAWQKTKDFGLDLTRRVTRHGKTILRDAFVESLVLALA